MGSIALPLSYTLKGEHYNGVGTLPLSYTPAPLLYHACQVMNPIRGMLKERGLPSKPTNDD